MTGLEAWTQENRTSPQEIEILLRAERIDAAAVLGDSRTTETPIPTGRGEALKALLQRGRTGTVFVGIDTIASVLDCDPNIIADVVKARDGNPVFYTDAVMDPSQPDFTRRRFKCSKLPGLLMDVWGRLANDPAIQAEAEKLLLAQNNTQAESNQNAGSGELILVPPAPTNPVNTDPMAPPPAHVPQPEPKPELKTPQEGPQEAADGTDPAPGTPGPDPSENTPDEPPTATEAAPRRRRAKADINGDPNAKPAVRRKTRYSLTKTAAMELFKPADADMPVREIRAFLISLPEFKPQDVALMSDEDVMNGFIKDYLCVPVQTGTLIMPRRNYDGLIGFLSSNEIYCVPSGAAQAAQTQSQSED